MCDCPAEVGGRRTHGDREEGDHGGAQRAWAVFAAIEYRMAFDSRTGAEAICLGGGVRARSDGRRPWHRDACDPAVWGRAGWDEELWRTLVIRGSGSKCPKYCVLKSCASTLKVSSKLVFVLSFRWKLRLVIC